MPFAPEKVSYDDTKKRTSTAYVKFTPEYRNVLRVLDTNAVLKWTHWIAQANGGKGLGVTCPNTSAQLKVCPVELSIPEGLPKDDPQVIEKRAKRRYMVNVLDRTPYTVCDACNEPTPAVVKGSTKVCINCSADVKKNTFAPLNKVKILEGGPRLFLETLNPIEQNGLIDWDKEITDYDIVFTTQGTGRDRKIAAMPQQPSELSEEDFIDTETGEPQKLFDLHTLAEPNTVEEIELAFTGATVAELNALRGIA